MSKFKNTLVKTLRFIISFGSFIWLGALMFVLDFVSKQVVLNNMAITDNIQLIPNFLSINYIINDGMAFGIDFRNAVLNRVMFAVISVIGAAILIAIYTHKYKEKNNFVKISLMLMISGCIGNLIDRAFYSAEYLGADTNGVVDFIGFKFGSYDFPRFNVADSCLVIGTILLIIWLFISEIKDLKLKKENKETTAVETHVSKDEKLLKGEDVKDETSENN